jgi:hypothetical protein
MKIFRDIQVRPQVGEHLLMSQILAALLKSSEQHAWLLRFREVFYNTDKLNFTSFLSHPLSPVEE